MDPTCIKGLQTSLPGRYAKALFEVAFEQKQADLILSSLKYFYFALEDSHLTAMDLMHIKKEDFKALISSCAQQLQWPAYLSHFFELIHEAKRLNLLSDMIRIFEILTDNAFERLPVHLSLPVLPSDAQKKDIENKISEFFGKEIRYEYEAVPSLLGGFVATIRNTLQVDGSISGQLNSLRTILKETSLKGAA